jgi:hypothetical protein
MNEINLYFYTIGIKIGLSQSTRECSRETGRSDLLEIASGGKAPPSQQHRCFVNLFCESPDNQTARLMSGLLLLCDAGPEGDFLLRV